MEVAVVEVAAPHRTVDERVADDDRHGALVGAAVGAQRPLQGAQVVCVVRREADVDRLRDAIPGALVPEA